MGWSEKYKKSINCDNPKGFSQRAHCQGRKKKMNEAKEKDHEVSMAKTQVKKSIDNLQKVARVLAKKTDADNLPAWVQAKLTDTEHNTDAAASYMGEQNVGVPGTPTASNTLRQILKNNPKYGGKPEQVLDRPGEKKLPLANSYEVEGELLDEKKRGGTLHNWFGKSKSKDGKPGWVQSDGSPCANEPGETKTPKCYSSRRLAGLKKTEEGKKKIRSADARKSRRDPGQQQKSGGAAPTMVRTFTDKKDYKKHKSGDYSAEGFEMQEARDIKGKGSGKKDACYHKVRSRYDVWPSAYASGALVKCRKVGAANWGTKSESFQYSNWREDFKALEIETIDLIKAEPLVNEGSQYKVGDTIPASATKSPRQKMRAAVKTAGEKYGQQAFKKEMPEFELPEAKDPCWDGYKQVGMKKKGGKMVPNCVKEGYSNWREELSEDWQKVNKQDKTDGMSQKAVNAYRRENPGSKLKTAVTEKDPGPGRSKRRKSFCARSKGQQDMHNIDCSKDPDKAICKARRRWRC